MNVRAALGCINKAVRGCKDVVVHQIRAVGDFDHEISVVLIVNIAADPSALSLPVQPCSKGTMVNIIVVDLYIDGGVEFDSGNLMPVEFMFDGNA